MTHAVARCKWCGLALAALLAGAAARAEVPVPPLRGRVNDYASLLLSSRAQALEQRLEQFENETGHQIAVLTIPTLQGEDIASFGIRVAESWKIGKKKFDNGAILIVARDDHRLRIEVGYGLEGILPDAIANRIIQEIIVPRFRDGDFPGGIEDGVEAIIKVTRGEHLPQTPRPTAKTQHAYPLSALGLLFMAALLAFFMGLSQPSLLHGAFSGACGGALFAIVASLGAGIAAGIAILLISLAVGAYGTFYSRSNWGGAWTDRGSRREPWVGNTFVGGYSGGESGSGGFGGSGGFSGGGGGFGGGGASGGW